MMSMANNGNICSCPSLPLFTNETGCDNTTGIESRLVPKPNACLELNLDHHTRTMGKMDQFANSVGGYEDYLRINFKHHIHINRGRVPSFEVIAIFVSNAITSVLPAGDLAMTNLRRRNLDDQKYWKFVRYMAKELSPVWRDIPLRELLYFRFENQFALKARDTKELHTMRVGGAGSYRIVGMMVRRNS